MIQPLEHETHPAPTPLPWRQGEVPLMLAPMQGLTNRALRALFIDWVRPDVVFTEFMRVNAAAPVKRLSAVDLKEAAAAEKGVPLVVQLIGHSPEPLVAAARTAQAAGAVHINLNMGCPYGRTTSGFTGGAMLRRPEELEATITALRRAVTGTVERAGLEAVAALTDGATRLVEVFRTADWAGTVSLLRKEGAAELISRVRSAEADSGQSRGKAHDDATAVLVEL